jgi:Amt family ammonium transporter
VVNDTCGHGAGDELLRQLSGVLRDSLRGTDTLARLGGDEFGVLLHGCSLEKGAEVADKLRNAVREFRFMWDGRTFAVGVSIGLVAVEAPPATVGQLLSRADAACYAAKDAGRNRVHVSQSDDVELAARKGEMRWISRIQRALDQDALRLYQQPIVPVGQAAGGPHHVEVLVRMEAEDGTLVPPGAFIPAAERYGLIADLDQWVLKNALGWLADHHRSRSPAVRCAINLSGVSLGDEHFPGMVKGILRHHGVPPELICFEITETAAIANLRRATLFINELKALGCSFALDDFGSGLSSFGYLQSLPVDYLKIDGRFVRDLDTDSVATAMVESINTIGHLMGLKTIAEFVETEPVLARLHRLGVDYAQGFLFQAPAPLEDLAGVHRLPR